MKTERVFRAEQNGKKHPFFFLQSSLKWLKLYYYRTVKKQHTTIKKQHWTTKKQHWTIKKQHWTTKKQHWTTKEQHWTTLFPLSMYEKCCSCCSLVVYVVGLWVMGCWVVGCWRTGRGGHRPTLVCLASIVGRWTPCHVLPTLGINNKYRRGLERLRRTAKSNKQKKSSKTFVSELSLLKEGGYLLSRIALQYHRRKWA